MAGISMSDIAFPLSFTEATNHMTQPQRQCTSKAPATAGYWWLRSPGNGATGAQCINSSSGVFANTSVRNTGAVRPALWILSMRALYRAHEVSAGCSCLSSDLEDCSSKQVAGFYYRRMSCISDIRKQWSYSHQTQSKCSNISFFLLLRLSLLPNHSIC